MKEKFRGNADRLAVGDQVFFYQVASKKSPGKLVYVATVGGALHQCEKESEVDNPEFTYCAKCKDLKRCVVERSKVLKILDRGNMRIPGGLLWITAAQSVALRHECGL